MELTVRSESGVQTLRCSYDGDRLVANGDWNISMNTSDDESNDISENENVFQQSDPLDTTEEEFIDTVLTLKNLVDISSNKHLGELVRKARLCIDRGVCIVLDGYVAILLQICRSEARHSLRYSMFEALLEVVEFEEEEFVMSEEASSELITFMFDSLEIKNNNINTLRLCLEILKILAHNATQNFVSQRRILIIFGILERLDTSMLSGYVLNLVKVLLRQPGLNNFQYFKEVLPSLERALESVFVIRKVAAARLCCELAMSFERLPEFIRKLTSRNIVRRIYDEVARIKNLQHQRNFFEEVLCYFKITCANSRDLNTYSLIRKTICYVVTGSKELPKSEFQFVLNPEHGELVTHLMTKLLRALSSYIQETHSLTIGVENVTQIKKTISCLFRISQKIFLSPSCDSASKLWCLKCFQFIIGCGWDATDFDNSWLPYLKCNEVVQHLMEVLVDFDTRFVAESVSAIDSMLKAYPHIVAKPFSMAGLHVALVRCVEKYQYLIRKSKINQTDQEKKLSEPMEILIQRLKMVKNSVCKMTIKDVNQKGTMLDNLCAAVKSLSEQKELHLMRMVIVDDRITPYMILETNLVPSLLYFLIGVEDIVGALNCHHSELNLRIGDREKIIRNNNIKKFVKLFLGCETDGSCPPQANDKEPFTKLISILQSTLPIVGCLNAPAKCGISIHKVQELLLHQKGNRDSSLDVNGPANMLDLYLIPHFEKPYAIDDPSSGIISLLNVLYGINEHYEDLYPPGSLNPPLPQEQFVSKYIMKTFRKFTSEANNYNKEFEEVCPLHMWKILFSCPFLVDFKSRWLIFKRLIRLWDCKKNSFRVHLAQSYYNGTMHTLISVRRSNIIEESEQYFTSSLVLTRPLLVNFKGELGVGVGPTQEFYTLISKEFQNTKFNLWRGDTSLANQLNGDRTTSDYVDASNGLYPKPISGRSSTENNALAQKFELLGKIMAKALLDGKVLDLNLNECFLNLLLRREQCMGMTELYKLDPQFGKTLSDLKSLLDVSQRSREIMNLPSSQIQQNNFKPELHGCSVDELGLDFTLPGYPEIALQKDGRNTEVNIGNLDKYIRLVCQWTLQAGVSTQLESVRKGFSCIFPLELFRLFNTKELRLLFCGTSEYQTLRFKRWVGNCEYENYDKESQVVKFLSEIVSEYDPPSQKSFLQFVTGSSRIPMNANYWKLRICRTCTKKENNADELLPTAMTCTRALYLPEYSNKEVMRNKLNYALQEGLNSFQMG